MRMVRIAVFAASLAVASGGGSGTTLYGMYSGNIGHAHPPEIPVEHQLAEIDPSSGATHNLGSLSAGGALGEQTGEASNYKGDRAMYVLTNFYNGTRVNVRIEKHSLDDGKVLGIYPLLDVPFIQWTSFGQQMVVNEMDSGLIVSVLAPSANLGGYVFNYTLYNVDIAKNKTVVAAELGGYMVSPSQAAGFPAAHMGQGLLYTMLTDPSTSQPVLLEIDCLSGKVVRTIANPPVKVFSADGNKALYGATTGITIGLGGMLELWKLEPDADTFTLVGKFPEIGESWQLAPPAISSFLFSDADNEGALIVTAVDTSGSAKELNTVALITLPTAGNKSSSKATVVKGFCTMKGAGLNYTCPKVISALKQPKLVIV